MHEIITRITSETGLDAGVADAALRTVLDFLRKDGPTERVDALVATLGLEEFGTGARGGGWLGSVGGFLGGGAMAAFSALTGLGLDLDQIQALVRSVLGYARERAGDETVDEIIAAIPGLSQLA
jgi:hypothetical protein